MSGIQSQAYGKMFEQVFLKRCQMKGMAIDRIPDGCRQIGKKVIRVKTPYDYVVTYQGKSGFFDTKTFNESGEFITKSKIKPHQLASLLMHERAQAIAGYVVFWRGWNSVRFYSSLSLEEVFEQGFSLIPHKLLGSIESFDPTLIFK